MQEILSLVLRQVRDTWRFRWYALGVAWLVAVCGWLYVYSLPSQYQVFARVHIDTKSAIRPLLKDMTVSPNTHDKINLLIRTVLSRPHLRQIVRRTDLSLKTTTPEAEQEMIKRLRRRIYLRNQGGGINLYRIAFSSSSADTARAVVQQVINIMTSMALGGDQNTGKARKFLTSEVASYHKRLDKMERKLTQYKQDHAGLMLSSDDYAAQLNNLQTAVHNLQDQLSYAQNKRNDLQQQLNSNGGGTTQNIPPEQSRQVRSIDARIRRQENQLQQLLTRYTPKHPDVVSLKHQIARLKRNRRSTIADLRKHPQRVTVGGGSGNTGRLRGQLDNTNNRISVLKNKIQRKQSRLSALQGDSSAMGKAQIKLARLNRNYNATKTQYNKLLNRLYTARLSTDANNTGNPIKFNLVDPPETPTEPTGPNRILLLSVAFAASLAAGAAFAFFMSQIRPVFINRRALTDFTGLPVLGSVSMAWTRRQIARRQSAVILFFGGIALLTLCFVGALMFAPAATRLVPTFLTNQWL